MELDFDLIKSTAQLLDCPMCSHITMIPLHEEGAKVDYCPECKGIWVDFAGEKEVLEIRPNVFSLDELKRLRKQYQPVATLEPVRYIHCPVCDELMNRKNWGSYSGVIVNRCDTHGTWYDDGKITKVREYVALGGIEYEKMRFAPREEWSCLFVLFSESAQK